MAGYEFVDWTPEIRERELDDRDLAERERDWQYDLESCE
jgi:hypothetical protein